MRNNNKPAPLSVGSPCVVYKSSIYRWDRELGKCALGVNTFGFLGYSSADSVIHTYIRPEISWILGTLGASCTGRDVPFAWLGGRKKHDGHEGLYTVARLIKSPSDVFISYHRKRGPISILMCRGVTGYRQFCSVAGPADSVETVEEGVCLCPVTIFCHLLQFASRDSSSFGR